MSLLAPASCDQPLGIIDGVCVCVFVCGLCPCNGVGLGALGRARGMRRGTEGGAGEGVGDEGVPHENQRNSLATGDRINTKWGAPIHLALRNNREPNDRDSGRGGVLCANI